MEPKPYQLVSCPYVPSHQVEHSRYQRHLTLCVKNYPTKNGMGYCPFDATHHVKAEELNYHVNNCPSRHMFDNQLYVTDDDHRPPVRVTMAQQNFQCDENWDDDNAETYNPEEAKKGAIIYNKIKGATKSERGKFRFEKSVEYSQAMAQQSSSSQKYEE